MADEKEDSKEIKIKKESSGGALIGILIIVIIVGAVLYVFFSSGGLGFAKKTGINVVDLAFAKIKSLNPFQEPEVKAELKKGVVIKNLDVEEYLIGETLMTIPVELQKNFDDTIEDLDYRVECGVRQSREEKLIEGQFDKDSELCNINTDSLKDLEEGKNIEAVAKVSFKLHSEPYKTFKIGVENGQNKIVSSISGIRKVKGPLSVDVDFTGGKLLKAGSMTGLKVMLSNGWGYGHIIVNNLNVKVPDFLSKNNNACGWDGNSNIYTVTDNAKIDNSKDYSCGFIIGDIPKDRDLFGVMFNIDYEFFSDETVRSVKVIDPNKEIAKKDITKEEKSG